MDKQSTQTRHRKRRRRRRRSRAPMIVMIAIILILLGVIVCLLLGGEDAQQVQQAQGTEVQREMDATVAPTATAQLEIDPNAGALITPTPAPVEPGVAIPGWGSMTIPAGVTEVQTSMQNPEANEGWYYLTFELRLKDTDEVIFTTGLIPPGQYCNQVTLSRPLEKGEYAAVIHVQPYRISDLSPTNNADMETVLIVE